MRKIKFREWNGKRYDYSPKQKAIQSGINDEFYFVESGQTGTVFEQFIGLRDTNLKEIYEGDIVKYYQPYSKRTDIHIVKWDNMWAAFGLFDSNDKWCKESDWQKIQKIEVIGNIHENPELLEVEK